MSPFTQNLATLLEAFLTAAQVHSPPCSLPPDFRAALLQREADLPDLPPPLASQLHCLCFYEEGPIPLRRGVPVHPLFKYLASALWDWCTNSTFPRQLPPIPGLPYDLSMEEKIKSWTDKIVESVDELHKLMQRVVLSLQVRSTLLSDILERRGNDVNISMTNPSLTERIPELLVYDRVSEGALLLLNKVFLCRVQATDEHASKSGVVYEAILDDQDSTNGLMINANDVKIVVEPVHVFQIQALPDHRQPIHSIRHIVEVLGMEGIRTLIGFRSTVGSIENALSPGWATLLSSFVALNTSGMSWHWCQTLIKSGKCRVYGLFICNAGLCVRKFSGSKLTVGGRALAKHTHRSTAGWWGHVTGDDDAKNALAMNVITRIMKAACWLNVHFVPPDLHVFEIRVHEGYGARWTADGSKVYVSIIHSVLLLSGSSRVFSDYRNDVRGDLVSMLL